MLVVFVSGSYQQGLKTWPNLAKRTEIGVEVANSPANAVRAADPVFGSNPFGQTARAGRETFSPVLPCTHTKTPKEKRDWG